HQRAVAENHFRPHTSSQRRTCIRRSRPSHQRSIRICRISRRQLQHLNPVRILLHSQRTQQIDRSRHRKLRRCKIGREISSPNLSALLHCLHHVVDRRKSAGQILRMRRLAKHHPIARQQLLRHRMTPLGSRTVRCKRRRIQCPPSLRSRRS